MSDFKKQYDKELKYQEEKSNKYTLNGVVMLIALELVVWALNAIGIFEIDRRTITVAVIISIILLIPIVFMIMKEDVSKECYKYIGLTLICTATGVMCALSCSTFVCHSIIICSSLQTEKDIMVYITY